MPTTRRRPTVAGLAGGLTLAALLVPAATAQPAPDADDVWTKGKYHGSSFCTTCHAQPAKRDEVAGALDFVLLTEYSIWKTHDKHAQAYAVLEGPRSAAMARLLGLEPKDLTAPKGGCLNCHATNVGKDRVVEGGGYTVKDGVSCGGCHGPSERWMTPHAVKTWREQTPQEKQRLGLRDLRDPVVRSELCLSCHVGNAREGKVVSHAMFAAGHPPLPPVEVATFSDNEPKHWRDPKDVPYFQPAFHTGDNDPQQIKERLKKYRVVVKNYHLEDLDFHRTKLALVGSVVALRETMRLVSDRADFGGKDVPPQAWPEALVEGAKADARFWPEYALAHSDCYACHHDLKAKSYRQERGFGYALLRRAFLPVSPGRPLVRTWPLAVPQACAGIGGDGRRLDDLEARFGGLARACNDRPFGKPADVRAAARQLELWCGEVLADLRRTRFTRDKVLGILHGLGRLCVPAEDGKGAPGVPALDYEGARQVASVLQVVYEEWRASGPADAAADKQVRLLFAGLSDQLNLQPYVKREDRLQVIMGVVKELSERANLKGMEEFTAYTRKIGDRALLKAMIDNDNEFIGALQRKVDPEQFTEKLKKREVVDRLQAFGDVELKRSLESVAAYDPRRFQEQLARLLTLLPPAPK